VIDIVAVEKKVLSSQMDRATLNANWKKNLINDIVAADNDNKQNYM